MPKLLEFDQIMFNRLKMAMADCIDRANLARMRGNDLMADWFMHEYERCSRDMDSIIAKYVNENEITTEVINGTRVTGNREYVEKMRKALLERTVNVNVVCVVRTSRQGVRS